MCVEVTFVLDIVHMASNHDSIKCESPQKGTLIMGVFLGIVIACGVTVIACIRDSCMGFVGCLCILLSLHGYPLRCCFICESTQSRVIHNPTYSTYKIKPSDQMK